MVSEKNSGMPDNEEEADKLYKLGLDYLYGTNVPKDYVKAAECFREACRMGSLPARRELGILYASGKGVQTDMEKAVRYLGEAADSLDPSALYHLGLMYEVGTGVPKDMQKAVRMLAYAAEMGFPGADIDAERVDAILTEQRNKNLCARPLLRLEISDVDVEAACCKPMLDSLLEQSIVFIDSYKGPALLGEDKDGMDAVLDSCPFCGAPVRIVPRDKKYRAGWFGPSPGTPGNLLISVAHPLLMEDGAIGAEDSARILRTVIENKMRDISDLEKAKARYRKPEKIEKTDALINYLRADMLSYLTVLADMTDDETILDGFDVDSQGDVECPDDYQDYLKSLSVEDAELESKADEIRTEYCNEILDENYQSIGISALLSPEMMEYILQDPYILGVIGDAIFNDDDLYDKFCGILETKKKGKKKGKKGGKGSKKGKGSSKKGSKNKK